MAATQNITIYRKEDIVLNVTMDPIEDATGWTVVFTVRQARTSPVIMSISGSITDGPSGKFQFILPSSSTDIIPQTYVFDIVRTDAGFDKVLTVGNLIVKSGVRTP